DLIGGGLAGHDQVAADLRAHGGFGDGAVGHEVVHGLLLGPALGVHAGVDHQADGAPHFGHQAAVFGVRVFVGAGHFLGQPFGVQAPAFGVGGGELLGAEGGDVLEFLGDRDLHVVAGQALVVGDHFQLGPGHGVHVREVGVVDARARAVGGGGVVVLGGAVLFAEGFHPANDEVGLGQAAEVFRQHLLDVVDRGGGVVDVGLAAFVGVGVAELRVVVDELEEGLEVALEAHLFHQRFHLAAQARDFVQAELVDLVGGHVGGGVLAQLPGVVGGAVRVGGAHAGRVFQRVRQLLFAPGNDALVG